MNDEQKILENFAPDPRPLAELLDDVLAFEIDYIAIGGHEAVVVVLWAVHTHVFDAFDCSPYLAVLSPEKRCGKSRQLRVLRLIVARPWHVVRPTQAVTYRKIHRDHPTVLLDECDAIWHGNSNDENNEGLRAILDAGNEYGVQVPRCIGSKQDLFDFDTFSPKALAGKRELPDTVADRAITVRLKRKAKSERVERFRRRDVEPRAAALTAELEAWAGGAHGLLVDARPELPDALDDRAQDAWEPLLAIADLAGGDWPRRARAAGLALSADDEYEDDTLGVRALIDIKRVFDEQDADRLWTVTILKALVDDEEAPWASYGRARQPLTAKQLGDLLGPFGIHSRTRRIGDATAKGYLREQFEDAWERYMTPSGDSQPSHRHNPHSSTGNGTSAAVTHEGSENGANPHGSWDVTALRQEPPKGRHSENGRVLNCPVCNHPKPVDKISFGIIYLVCGHQAESQDGSPPDREWLGRDGVWRSLAWDPPDSFDDVGEVRDGPFPS